MQAAWEDIPQLPCNDLKILLLVNSVANSGKKRY
jgi:hypothetical protein